MDFGAAIFFTDYSMGPAELGRALEERGFGSLWAPEHSHIPLSRRSPFPQGGELPKKYYDVMDPFVTLAAAAAATTRLQVATGVCLVVQRDPIQTAKQVASLDQISGGRFLFGIGAGWNAEEMADHGTDFTSRFEVMRERVEAMKAIWTKSKPEYDGKFVKFPPMMTWPKPVQKPHPPVIVGGAFPYGARRAIARLVGWADRPGGSLLLAVPITVVHLVLRPAFPAEHDWADFGYLLAFFVTGYVLIGEPRLLAAVRRDGMVALAVGVAGFAGLLAGFATGSAERWITDPAYNLESSLVTILFSVYAWSWVVVARSSSRRAPLTITRTRLSRMARLAGSFYRKA